MVSFIAEAQSIAEKLKMFIEVKSLDDVMNKLDEYYMVMILCALHLDFYHIRDQLLTSHEVSSVDTLTAHLLCVPVPQTQKAHDLVEPSVIVAT